MGLETGTYIADLVSSNPLGSDLRSTADDHLRLVKALLQNTLPGAAAPYTLGFVTDTGAANAMAVTLTPAPSAYVAGMTIRVKPAAVNTGAVTLDVNALGVKSVIDMSGNALTAGDLTTTGVYTLVYDGTNFVVVNAIALETLRLLKLVDGSGSGLDADLLDGNEAGAFAAAGHGHTVASLSDTTSTPSSNMALVYDGVSTWDTILPTGHVTTVTEYTVPGTYTFTPSDPARPLYIYLIAGGGGGGQGYTSTVTKDWIYYRGGSGGVGFVGDYLLGGSGGSVTVTVGAGGAGNNSGDGAAGGTSSFGTFISVTGGGGGLSATSTGNGANGADGTVTSDPSVGYPAPSARISLNFKSNSPPIVYALGEYGSSGGDAQNGMDGYVAVWEL